MIATTPLLAAGWNDQQRAAFQAQMSAWQKDEVVGVLFALFLGTFGAHHFYLRRTGLGILYCCFFWTGLPTLVSMIEAFFMPERVREYNAQLAAYIAAQMGTVTPAVAVYSRACPACGSTINADANFCSICGSKITK
ncbi:NINE protein [Silvibacterium acidisoli]|uniref:NINE protein n=1 Tax=Acidobacteriaceae bacterium ZG23-2 TaxID=2883246 RepID=UPI00406C8C34